MSCVLCTWESLFYSPIFLIWNSFFYMTTWMLIIVYRNEYLNAYCFCSHPMFCFKIITLERNWLLLKFLEPGYNLQLLPWTWLKVFPSSILCYIIYGSFIYLIFSTGNSDREGRASKGYVVVNYKQGALFVRWCCSCCKLLYPSTSMYLFSMFMEHGLFCQETLIYASRVHA